MKLIVPCCGKSTRFPNMRPKWMLTHPDGNLMVKKAIENINIPAKDVVITILREHEEKYDVVKGLKENIGKEITVVVLDEQTRSQPETVYMTLQKLNLKESFFIKDSDNTFAVPKIDEDYNYVCYSDLQDYDSINPGNKSYIALNEQKIITNIVEKKVISKFFNVGGYFFKSPEDYKSTYEKLSKGNSHHELYTSHIIHDLTFSQGKVFFGKEIKTYVDWGTFEQWQAYRQKFKTYLIDIDGVVFKSAAQFFKPRWKDAQPIESNVEVLKKLCDDKNTQVIFITSRAEEYRKITEEQLAKLGLKHDGLIMGCLHANRVIINDFSSTTKYPTCEAINIVRDSEDLHKYI